MARPATERLLSLARSPRKSRRRPARRMSAVDALARRTFLDARTRTIAFAYVFAVYAYIQPVGFRGTLPDRSPTGSRSRTASRGNDAIRLFYGYPFDLVDRRRLQRLARRRDARDRAPRCSALLAAVRALRDRGGRGPRRSSSSPGRCRGGPRSPRRWPRSLRGVADSVAWPSSPASSSAAWPSAGRPIWRSRPRPSYRCSSAIGAIACQLAPTRRVALELGGAVVAAFLLLRVVADTVERGRLAALGDAARLGRGAAAVHRRRAGSCCCCRSRRARR